MAEPGALERGHVRAQLIRELATGEFTQVELASRHGVSQPSISAFASRHADEITRVAGKIEDEFAGLWAASKLARLAEYQQDVEDVEQLLTDPDTAARAGVQWAEMKRIKAQALRAIADELGQIPARMQVEHTGRLDVVVNGVDLGALQ